LPSLNDTKRIEFTWYDLSEYTSQRQAEQTRNRSQDVTLSPHDDPEGGGKFIGAYTNLLKQGRSLGMQPFYIVFGDHPIQDIEIKYKIYAKNQPRVTEGMLTVRVVENQG
jgi:hypothetical protein